MRREFFLWLGVIAVCLASAVGTQAQSQTESLGDYARAVKKNARPAKASGQVYDNDNIPRSDSLSIVGKEPADAQSEQNKEKDADTSTGQAKDSGAPAKEQTKSADPDKKEDPQMKAGQSAEERQKAIDAWKQKLDDQKGKVDLAARDLDVSQREYQLKAAEFYADTARRAQNPNGFAEDETKFKEKIAQKQKALDEAKSKLGEMQDDARRQGAPNSVTE